MQRDFTLLRLTLKARHSNAKSLTVTFQSIGQEHILCFAARTNGLGKNVLSPPKGWNIRRDPKDSAFPGQPKHYHCTNRDGTNEIVITESGHGSHATKTGDKIPKKLGKFLVENLHIPVKKIDGVYIVRLEIDHHWRPYENMRPSEILNEILNNWYLQEDENTDEE